MRGQSSNTGNILKFAKLRSLRVISKPREGEFPAHAHTYIDLLPDDGQVLHHLEDNLASTKKVIASIPPTRLLHRYVKGKWTIKEILGHIVDDERIYVTHRRS